MIICKCRQGGGPKRLGHMYQAGCPKFKAKTPTERLKEIRELIERVDHRASFGDIVVRTLSAMTDEEMRTIYRLAGGKPGE